MSPTGNENSSQPLIPNGKLSQSNVRFRNGAEEWNVVESGEEIRGYQNQVRILTELEHVHVSSQKDSSSQFGHEPHPQPARSDPTRKPPTIDEKVPAGALGNSSVAS
jgi:hypothetical protein